MLLLLGAQRAGTANPDAGSAGTVPAAIFTAFDRYLGSRPGCVLRTASVSISRSSALVMGACRVVDFCQLLMESIWGSLRGMPPFAFSFAMSGSGRKNPRPVNGRGSRNQKLCQYNRGQSNVMAIAAAYAARRSSAADLPVRRSATISNETFCPSLRVFMPARSTALM